MGKDQLSRKLAVILHADVVGSTLLVQKNDALTHERIQAAFHQFSETINSFGGITHELRGDALVAEFDRASDAVTAALAFQVLNEAHNATLDDDIQPLLRIGISLGEVIIADNILTGAGVVLAQRLEQLADSGGIVVQGSVSETVPTRMPFDFESLGEQQLKGFDQPVRAFTVRLQPGKELPAPEKTATSQTFEPEGLQVPDKPSIAVLPFNNMSADPEQDYFADGITEDLLTKLTSILGLFVIARNSSFRYKGKTVDVRQVSQELGVRYILEGSVRKAGNRVRVTAQLIEAATGSHLWAEHYDRDLTDVFAVQDDITANVVQALQVTLLEGEQARVWHRSTNNLEAWSCLTRAKTHFEDHLTMEESRAGIELLERAVDLDPNYASAWAWLGWLLSHEVRFLWTDDPDAVLTRAAQCGDKALALDDGLAEAHMLLAFVHVLSRDFDKAIAQAERGVALGPSNADVVAVLALNLVWAGRPEEALTVVEKAMRLSPMYSPWFTVVRAHALRLLGRFEEAMKTYKGAIASAPGYIPPYIGLTLCYAEMGREHDAQEQGRKLLKLNPRFSTARYLSTPGYKDRSLTERSAQALRKAGLPD
jgi:adenylate cyclase